ncbi:MAG TPA: hypothetical protein VGD01_16225 [Candidatus Elarobacter sp.]|jgi:hypothetical protein
MRSLLARLAVLGAFAVTMAGCSNGNASSLPFAGPPNNAGGVPGTVQAGSNGTALIRFVQGSPTSGTGGTGSVDVCIDNLPFGITAPTVQYGRASSTLYGIAGGVTHTISVFPSLVAPPPGTPATPPGSQCSTAPGPYFGAAPIAIATLSVGNNVRWTVVLGGTGATLGLYIFNEPTFSAAPAGAAAISHNAAPAFSTGKPNGVGFGICTTTVAPCAVPVGLTGAQGVAKANPSSPTASVVNSPVTSGLNSIPAGFYDGIGVPAGTPVPITSIPAPSEVAGQPYVIQLYAIDGPAGGLNLVGVLEQTLGFGF